MAVAAANEEVACADGKDSSLGAPASGGRRPEAGGDGGARQLHEEVDADGRRRGGCGAIQRSRRRGSTAAAASAMATHTAPHSPALPRAP